VPHELEIATCDATGCLKCISTSVETRRQNGHKKPLFYYHLAQMNMVSHMTTANGRSYIKLIMDGRRERSDLQAG
jgi:hypothetical protein